MSRQKKINIEMGARIKALRESSGQKQDKLALKAGIRQGAWSKAEYGNLPDIDILFRISKALKTTVDYLWCGDNLSIKPVVSKDGEEYQPFGSPPCSCNQKKPKPLQDIIDGWQHLEEFQRIAISTTFDAFSKQTSLSLKVNGTQE